MNTQESDQLIEWIVSQLSVKERAVWSIWNPNNQQNNNFSTSGASRNVIDYQNTMNQMLCTQAQNLNQSGMSQQVPGANWNSPDGTDINMRSLSSFIRIFNSQPADSSPSLPHGPDVFSYNTSTMNAQSLAQHSPHGQLAWHSAVQPVQYSVPGSRSSTLSSAGLPPTHPNFDQHFAQELQAPPHPIPHTAGREPYVCHKCLIPGHNIHDCPLKESEPSTPYRGDHLSNARFKCRRCRQEYEAQIYPGNTVDCPNCGVANKCKKMFKIRRAGPYTQSR